MDRSDAARGGHDMETARATALEAIAALIARSSGEQDAAWLELLSHAGSSAASADALDGARTAQEGVLENLLRTREPDDADVQTARGRLGVTRRALGDLRGARELFEQVVEAYERTLPDDGAALQLARVHLGSALYKLGDARAARPHFERVLAARTRTLPENHSELRTARIYVALVLKMLGEFTAARALEEQVLEVCSKTLPDDHPDLQAARQNLSVTLATLGDLAGARVLDEKVLEVRTRTLPEDHPDLQSARINLALTLKELGHLQEARALEEQALSVLVRLLPDEHPDLQVARFNLGGTLYALGDARAARSLFERVVEVYSRTLPAEHTELQKARMAMGAAGLALGDLRTARPLFEQSLEVLARSLPEEHPEVQRAQLGLAVATVGLGDLHTSRALFERCLAVRERTLPDDHPELQVTRQGLALTMHMLGDLQGARRLFERALEVSTRLLPDDHPDLQKARGNLGASLAAQGDLDGARELFRTVFEVRSRALPDEHVDVQRARQNLASTARALGDLDGARELEERVLAAFSRGLPDDHPFSQQARSNLAHTLHAQRNFDDAAALLEKVLEVGSRALPDDHPELQQARQRMAVAILARAAERAAAGQLPRSIPDTDVDRAVALVRDSCRAQVHAAQRTALSSAGREAEEIFASMAESLALGLSMCVGIGIFAPSEELLPDVFACSEATRGAAVEVARLARRSAHSPEHARLSAELQLMTEDLAKMAREGATREEFDRARSRREAVERDLVRRASELTGGSRSGQLVDAASMAQSLRAEEAVVCFRRFAARRLAVEPSAGADPRPLVRETTEDSLCAFVVRSALARDRAEKPLTLVHLGSIAPIEQAIEAWRAALGSASGRGQAVDPRTASTALDASGVALRRLIFDPLLPALGASKHAILVLDDVLHLVAFDCLPIDPDGRELIGDRFRIDLRTNLVELLAPREPLPGAASLLALGDVAYEVESSDNRIHDALAQASGMLRGSVWSTGFPPLPGTRGEIEELGWLFSASFGVEGSATLLTRAQASKRRLIEQAPLARFLHIATHGWFAPDAVRSWNESAEIERDLQLPGRTSSESELRCMSPMLLCGLALADANLPEDAIGRAPGLITAEELSTLDLSRCELAVLSACDTNVGERRAGQGVASLQRAMQMAGARSVITSLWKVPDEATRELMIDFYRRLWVEKKPKHQALWEAKTKLREAKDERGMPKYTTRDWAAWVLTGSPD